MSFANIVLRRPAVPSVHLCWPCRGTSKSAVITGTPRGIRGQEGAGGAHSENSDAGCGLTYINRLSAADLQLIAAASPGDLRRLWKSSRETVGQGKRPAGKTGPRGGTGPTPGVSASPPARQAQDDERAGPHPGRFRSSRERDRRTAPAGCASSPTGKCPAFWPATARR